MASKKNFMDALNPATMFISTATQQQPAHTAPQDTEHKTLKHSSAPDGYKVNPAFVETKSRRVNLLMQPSLFEKVKAKAAKLGISANEYIHSILEDATREE